MPATTDTKINQSTLVTPVTLNGTDTFVYVPGSAQRLVLRNPTAGALTPKLVGDAAPASRYIRDVGYFNLSAGFPASGGSIAAGASAVYDLDNIAMWLIGNCTITAGTGLTASILVA